MKVVIFGKVRKKPLRKGPLALASRPKGKDRGVERHDIKDLANMLAELPADTLIYVDVSGLSSGERVKTLAGALKKAPGRVGVLDPKGSVKDVASLFHAGFVDYIRTPALPTALSQKR